MEHSLLCREVEQRYNRNTNLHCGQIQKKICNPVSYIIIRGCVSRSRLESPVALIFKLTPPSQKNQTIHNIIYNYTTYYVVSGIFFLSKISYN